MALLMSVSVSVPWPRTVGERRLKLLRKWSNI